ncbi:MAG: cation transport ATpase [Firmicutes bacterium]|nr:cation transport ATpase [Bacillota bacterium]
MDPIKKISVKAHFFLGLIIATIVCLGVVVIGALGIEATWPAFFVMISFFITGASVKNLPSIFIGSITGLILAFLLLIAATPTMAALGPTLGLLLLVWLIVFSIVFGQEFLPQAFNNFAFIYFTIALIFAGEAATMTPAAILSEYVTWALTAILGGGGILAGIIGCITLARKAGLLPPAGASEH